MEIKIREVNIEDASSLVEIYRYYVEETAISFEYETPSIDEFKQRIRNIEKKYPYIVACIDDKIVGYAYASDFIARKAYQYCAEVTIYCDQDYRHMGLGKKLYVELEQRLKEQGIKNLYACIGYPEVSDTYLNTNSVDFHAHLGYRFVGEFKKCGYKFNTWYNMVWMEKMIGQHD